MRATPGEELYPIRTVASLTGVNPVTLRAWERRYGLVRPQRAPSGHRLYSRDDVELLRRVVALLERGVPIGRAREMLQEPAAPAAPVAPAGGSNDFGTWRARMLDAIAGFDEARLEAVYNDCLALHPVERVHEQVVVPLLRELGKRWERHRGGIAEEHFFTTYLRNKLGARFHHLSSSAAGPVLVSASMPDDRHDLGLLMFSHTASLHGYRVVMLGAAVPLRELAPAVRGAGAAALVLSMTVPPARRVLDPGLGDVVREVAVPVLVGGAQSVVHATEVEAAGALVLGTSVPAALARIDALLGATRGAYV